MSRQTPLLSGMILQYSFELEYSHLEDLFAYQKEMLHSLGYLRDSTEEKEF